MQEYKKRGGTYEGKETKTAGLNRWFLENWKNERGEVGYKYKNDIYRPTVRVTKETPTTFKEFKPQEIEKAKREKYLKGRVSKFNK